MPIVKGVEELVSQFDRGSASGFLTCLIAVLYFLTIYALEALGSSTILTPFYREILADYAYVVSIFLGWSVFEWFGLTGDGL